MCLCHRTVTLALLLGCSGIPNSNPSRQTEISLTRRYKPGDTVSVHSVLDAQGGGSGERLEHQRVSMGADPVTDFYPF